MQRAAADFVAAVYKRSGNMNKNDRFKACFQEYKDQLVRLVVSKTGDYELAQEIGQQVFCAFYIHMDAVEDDFVKAWLIKSTRNAIVDHYRKLDIRKEISLDAENRMNLNRSGEASGENCENQVIYSEMLGRIFREIRKDNKKFYEVLVMVCVDGMSYEETARRLNVSEQVVRTRLSRARKYVRDKYGDEYWGSQA